MNRSASRITLLAFTIASSAMVSTLGAQTVYKAGAHRYSVDQTMNARQTMQGQSVESTARTHQEISFSLTQANQGLAFTFVVDSASTAIDGVPPEQMAAANEGFKQVMGKTVTGTFSPQGKVIDATMTDSGPAAAQLLAGARNFLPILPEGGITAGTSWNDSTAGNFNNNGVVGTTLIHSKSTVTGDTAIAGEPAWRVTRSGTLSMSGKGMSQGTDVALDGSGDLEGQFYISKDGAFLGGEQQLTQKMTLTVPAAGITIPIEQKIITQMKRMD